MTCGIYKISLKNSDRCYIGSSKQIEIRWETHRYDLRLGTHVNKFLQSLWNKYGEDSFTFEVVEYCLESELLRVEQCWIDSVPVHNRINLNSFATKPPDAAGRKTPNRVPVSRETVEKRSISCRETWTEEKRLEWGLKMRERGAQPPNATGRKRQTPITDDERKKRSDAAKNRKRKSSE